MRLTLLAAALLGAGPVFAQVEYLGTFVWDDPRRDFGGFSGIEVTDDGAGMVAISDRALIVTARLDRDGDSRITGVTVLTADPLVDTEGRALGLRRGDSEGIAIGADGLIYLAFEGDPRLRVQDGPTGMPRLLPRNPDFAALPSNGALESLAIGPDGALYTIPERSGRANRPFPVHRLRGEVWDIPFAIPRSGSFLVTGADIGPDGMLYVLERDFTGIGFRSRVRRFDMTGGSEETLIETGTGTHDNLEGISVWDDGQDLRLTMIADDNFRFFQQTQIVEYRIRD